MLSCDVLIYSGLTLLARYLCNSDARRPAISYSKPSGCIWNSPGLMHTFTKTCTQSAERRPPTCRDTHPILGGCYKICKLRGAEIKGHFDGFDMVMNFTQRVFGFIYCGVILGCLPFFYNTNMCKFMDKVCYLRVLIVFSHFLTSKSRIQVCANWEKQIPKTSLHYFVYYLL